jgi:4-hydroxybenzoate decarboxylase
MTVSLGEYLGQLRSRGQLLVVHKEVDPKFELNAVARKIQAGPNLPVLFEKVRGTRYPVVSNTFGNYGLIARLLGVDIGRVAARWTELTGSMAPIVEEHPSTPATYEDVSLLDLPQIIYSEKDAGPYLTASVIIAHDPDSGIVNLSYHRMQIIGANELRCRLSTSGDLYRIQQKMEKRGDPTPAVVAIGMPPAVMLAGAATIGPMVSEYDFAARISGRRFPMRPSPLTGLPIPAATEFIIEGEILSGVRRPEGPFGEWMDYYVPVMDNHVFAVKKVYARKNAIFYAISSGSSEELAMSAVPLAGSIYNGIRTWVPAVRDVSCFPLLQFCAVQIAKTTDGQAQRAMLAAFGAEMNRILYCVVVDEDVDIHNWNDVLWAMATRCRPDRDIVQIPGVPSFARDPHRMHWGRLGIDATKPLEHLADFERKKAPGLNTLKLEDYIGS